VVNVNVQLYTGRWAAEVDAQAVNTRVRTSKRLRRRAAFDLS